MSTITHSPSEVLQAYFVGQGLGTLGHLQQYNTPPGNWPIYASYMPPEGPDQAVCIYDTSPVYDGRVMLTGAGVHHPGIQVMVRATDWPTTYSKAVDFHNALEQVKGVVVTLPDGSAYTISNAAEVKLPMRVGQEIGKNRMLCSVNCVLTIPELNQ